MATGFESFDASPLGEAFWESPVGEARDGSGTEGNQNPGCDEGDGVDSPCDPDVNECFVLACEACSSLGAEYSGEACFTMLSNTNPGGSPCVVSYAFVRCMLNSEQNDIDCFDALGEANGPCAG